jgi:hypothetical protein
MISENTRLQIAADDAKASTAESLRISNETAATARSDAERKSEESNVELRLKLARLEATANEAAATTKANEETSKAREEAAAAKAKVAVYELMLKDKTANAASAAALADKNKTAEECSVRERRTWAQEDETMRLQTAAQSERQRSLLALASLSKSNDQPFSPTTAAQGLMQVTMAPVAATCTAAANNEAMPMPAATSPRASSATLRMSTAPAPLAIMSETPETETLTDELVAENNKTKQWKAMLTTMMTRLDTRCANMSPLEIEDDERAKVIRTQIADLEARIIASTSRADEITDAVFETEMN